MTKLSSRIENIKQSIDSAHSTGYLLDSRSDISFLLAVVEEMQIGLERCRDNAVNAYDAKVMASESIDEAERLAGEG